MHRNSKSIWKTDNLPKRLLLVRLDNIGDIIMLGPSIRAIKRSFPETQLTLMASPAGMQAAPLLPWLDDTITWRAIWQDISGNFPQDPKRELALIQQLTLKAFDGAFIFSSFSQSPYPPAYLCYLANIPVRVGQSKEFGGSLLTHWKKPPPDSGHQVDRNLALLEIAGLDVIDRRLELHIPEAEKRITRDLLKAEGIGNNQSYIVAAPGASCSSRRYSIDRFTDVIDQLSKKSELPIVVIGSQKEKKILEPILQLPLSNRKIFSLVGKTSVAQLAAVIQNATLTLTNNSASLHIADAFQIPMVILYSGTEYESQWKPRFSSFRLLRIPTDCSPCYTFQCPYSMECLDITPDVVVENALDLLNGHSREQMKHLVDDSIYRA
jgi:ADP-heptose:LPS heptosyltransferase